MEHEVRIRDLKEKWKCAERKFPTTTNNNSYRWRDRNNFGKNQSTDTQLHIQNAL